MVVLFIDIDYMRERERDVREWFMNEDEETKDNSTTGILDG